MPSFLIVIVFLEDHQSRPLNLSLQNEDTKLLSASEHPHSASHHGLPATSFQAMTTDYDSMENSLNDTRTIYSSHNAAEMNNNQGISYSNGLRRQCSDDHVTCSDGIMGNDRRNCGTVGSQYSQLVTGDTEMLGSMQKSNGFGSFHDSDSMKPLGHSHNQTHLGHPASSTFIPYQSPMYPCSPSAGLLPTLSPSPSAGLLPTVSLSPSTSGVRDMDGRPASVDIKEEAPDTPAEGILAFINHFTHL